MKPEQFSLFALLITLPLAACAEAGGSSEPDGSVPDTGLRLSDAQRYPGGFGEHMGRTVATDGTIVAASAADYVVVFARNDADQWVRSDLLVPEGDEQSLVLLAAGDGTILTEARSSNRRELAVYERQVDGWSRAHSIDVGMREFSWASISRDWIVAAPIFEPKATQQVWVYERGAAGWQRDVTFRFDGTVVPTAYGHWDDEIAFVVHSKPGEEPSSQVRLYSEAGGWAESARVEIPETPAGNSIALRDSLMAVGRTTGTGTAMQLFARTSNATWIEVADEVADKSRGDVAIATDIVVMAQHGGGEGRAPRVLAWTPNGAETWTELEDDVFVPSDDEAAYGSVTAAAGDVVVIGQPGAEPGDGGAIYIHDVIR